MPDMMPEFATVSHRDYIKLLCEKLGYDADDYRCYMPNTFNLCDVYYNSSTAGASLLAELDRLRGWEEPLRELGCGIEALVDTGREINRVREKFPANDLLMVALTEEVGELAKALLDETPERIYKEAIQVACVALRIATEGDATVEAWRAKREGGGDK